MTGACCVGSPAWLPTRWSARTPIPASSSRPGAGNDNILQVAVIDAMGHGLDAATMATVTIGACRYARRVFVSLAEKYAFMDDAISRQFGPDHFVTAQLMHVNIAAGELELVNAGHPAPLLIRDCRVVRQLGSATTLPVGLGGEVPSVRKHTLQQGCATPTASSSRPSPRGSHWARTASSAASTSWAKSRQRGVRADLRRRSPICPRRNAAGVRATTPP
jgi:hypothetical protein